MSDIKQWLRVVTESDFNNDSTYQSGKVVLQISLDDGDYESLVNIESRAKNLDVTGIVSHIIQEYEQAVSAQKSGLNKE
jgi:hypothetical protein